MVWDGTTPGRYEVWYLTFNDRPSGLGFWIRYTLDAPGPRPGARGPSARLWFAVFDRRDPDAGFALNRPLPLTATAAEAEPFLLRLGEALLTHGSAMGRIAGGGHEASWDLTWTPSARSLRHLPAWAYSSPIGGTRVLSPNPHVHINGTVHVDGRRVDLHDEPGGQTHVWGTKHAHAWAWGHCNAFDGRQGVVLETLSVRLKRAGLSLPTLTLVTVQVGEEVLAFTRVSHLLRARGRWGTGSYSFSAQDRHARLTGSFSCRAKDMVVAEYEDPDGERAYCANTEVADLDLTLSRGASSGKTWEAERLQARGTGHFEVAGRRPDPAVPRPHLEIP